MIIKLDFIAPEESKTFKESNIVIETISDENIVEKRKKSGNTFR